MSTVLGERSLPDTGLTRRFAWLLVAAGLAALYLPVYLDLATSLWRDDEYAHGPLILGMFAVVSSGPDADPVASLAGKFNHF